jgi:hypothetical protein
VTPQDRRRAVEEQLVEEDTGAVLFDGLDGALVGVGRIQTGPSLAVYSSRRILEVLQEGGDMDADDALEWYLFNIQGLYAGPGTPIIVDELEV